MINILNKALLTTTVLFLVLGNLYAGDCQIDGHYEGHIIESSMWNISSLHEIDAVINSKMHCDIDVADERRVLDILLKESICSNVYGINQSILGKLDIINSGQPEEYEYLFILKRKSPTHFGEACKTLESIVWPEDEFIPMLFSKSSYVPENQQQKYAEFWGSLKETWSQISKLTEIAVQTK